MQLFFFLNNHNKTILRKKMKNTINIIDNSQPPLTIGIILITFVDK